MSEIKTTCEQIVTSLARQVKHIRESKNLSKRELSQLSGVSRASIRRIEEGERSPSIYLLLLLTKSMDVNLWELLKKKIIKNSVAS